MPRLVQHYAAKPQIQERLTSEIVNIIMEKIEPEGAFVVIIARHLCMEMRGIKSIGNSTITSAARGIFLDDMNVRQETLKLFGVENNV
jgi:GTP cyclohydrolase I